MLVPDRTPELDKHIGDMFAELPKLFKQRRLFGACLLWRPSRERD